MISNQLRNEGISSRRFLKVQMAFEQFLFSLQLISIDVIQQLLHHQLQFNKWKFQFITIYAILFHCQ